MIRNLRTDIELERFGDDISMTDDDVALKMTMVITNLWDKVTLSGLRDTRKWQRSSNNAAQLITSCSKFSGIKNPLIPALISMQ